MYKYLRGKKLELGAYIKLSKITYYIKCNGIEFISMHKNINRTFISKTLNNQKPLLSQRQHNITLNIVLQSKLKDPTIYRDAR